MHQSLEIFSHFLQGLTGTRIGRLAHLLATWALFACNLFSLASLIGW